MKQHKPNNKLTQTFLASKAALSRYLATFFARKEDIEDTVQEVFIKAQQAHEQTEIQSPKAYMFRVARNIAINKKRRQKIVYEENIGDFSSQIVIEDESASVFDQTYGEAKVRAFDEALSSLSPQCRKVFWMQRIEGLSYKEIAQRLGISVRTVEHNLAKALVHCAEHLAARGYSDGGISKVASLAKARKRRR